MLEITDRTPPCISPVSGSSKVAITRLGRAANVNAAWLKPMMVKLARMRFGDLGRPVTSGCAEPIGQSFRPSSIDLGRYFITGIGRKHVPIC